MTAPRPAGIRPEAVDAWRLLQRALLGVEPWCRSDPELWTDPADVDEVALAVRLCATCPVRVECGQFAEANREVAGVWAGIDRRPKLGRPKKEARSA